METNADETASELTTCPACGGNAWTETGPVRDHSITGEDFHLRSCSRCGFRITLPQPGPSAIGRYYASPDYVSHSDTNKGLVNRLYHQARNLMLRKKYRWVRQASSLISGKVLDIGAGTGYFANYMRDHGWQVTGLEPDETARKVAWEKLNFQVQDTSALFQLPAQSFDVITMWHVLEHVHDLDGYLQQIHVLLKREGVLIIAVPNYTSPDAKYYGSHWAGYDVPRHLWHFSPQSMRLLLARFGFTVTRTMPMHLDAFYVSMLSEKYKGRKFSGIPSAVWAGLRTWIAALGNGEKSSSVIYVCKK